MNALNALKSDIEKSVMSAVDENAQFQLETNVSDFALAGTSNQHGVLLLFFANTDKSCMKSFGR